LYVTSHYGGKSQVPSAFLPTPPAPGLFYGSFVGCPFFSFLFSFYRSSYPHDNDKIADFERLLGTSTSCTYLGLVLVRGSSVRYAEERTSPRFEFPPHAPPLPAPLLSNHFHSRLAKAVPSDLDSGESSAVRKKRRREEHLHITHLYAHHSHHSHHFPRHSRLPPVLYLINCPEGGHSQPKTLRLSPLPPGKPPCRWWSGERDR